MSHTKEGFEFLADELLARGAHGQQILPSAL